MFQILIWLSWLLEANRELSALNTRDETGHLLAVGVDLGQSLIILPEPRSQTFIAPLSSERKG